MVTNDVSKHELLDRTHLISDMFERYVAEHEALGACPLLKEKVEAISTQLHDLYQAVGQEFLKSTSASE